MFGFYWVRDLHKADTPLLRVPVRVFRAQVCASRGQVSTYVLCAICKTGRLGNKITSHLLTRCNNNKYDIRMIFVDSTMNEVNERLAQLSSEQHPHCASTHVSGVSTMINSHSCNWFALINVF